MYAALTVLPTDGTSVFLLTCQDDGGTLNGGRDTSRATEFSIRVTFVNEPPSFAILQDFVVAVEDGGAQVCVHGILEENVLSFSLALMVRRSRFM